MSFENHQSPITNHQSPITNHQSPITNHQSPITNHQSPITNHQSPIDNHQSPITNHQSPIPLSIMNTMTPHIQEQILDDILNLLRPYFEQERELNERIPNCETEADLYARQRATLLAQAQLALRSQLEAIGMQL